jgi:L-threonylcarbamoyladenylate synthase
MPTSFASNATVLRCPYLFLPLFVGTLLLLGAVLLTKMKCTEVLSQFSYVWRKHLMQTKISTKTKRSITYYCSNNSDIFKCASVVSSGGILVYPTDTIYGIGCDPYNDISVQRIFKIKARNKRKPLPILAGTLEDVEKIVSLGRIGMLLARMYWPGALTIVSPLKDNNISTQLTAGKRSVGVRIPNNKCILQLLKQCKYIAGTSANISGEKPPKSASEVISSSLHHFDALLDGGSVDKGIESTIVDIVDPTAPKIIREGAIKSEHLRKVLPILRTS